ncbi:hypothetical protein JHD50_06395 [Sulfurimonas sp. MAG313]|nr:hypothetical protein [Sulfurimonas sp. MAG313]MDF1880936.1 hypothetical protein [Sulfurimonas sp. MAG313]
MVFKRSKAKTYKTKPPVEAKKQLSLEELISIVKTQATDVEKMDEALSLMSKNFPFPSNENDAKQHFKFVYLFAKNPLSNAKLIVKMQKDLSSINPKYSKQIEDFQMRGVNAR